MMNDVESYGERVWLSPREQYLLTRRYRQKWEDACARRAKAEIAAAKDAAECFAVYQASEYLAPEDSGAVRRLLRSVGLIEEKYPLPVPEACPATAEEAKKKIPFLFYIFSNYGLDVRCSYSEESRGNKALYVEDEEAASHLQRIMRAETIVEATEESHKIIKEEGIDSSELEGLLSRIAACFSKDERPDMRQKKEMSEGLTRELEKLGTASSETLRSTLDKMSLWVYE